MELFPLSDNELTYNQFVRSSVIIIDTAHPEKYNANKSLVLSLKIDYILGSRHNYDYCLGRVNETEEWECVNNEFISNTDDMYSYYIYNDGTYAILYYPIDKIIFVAEDVCDWWCVLTSSTTVIIIVTTIASILLLYIFWRMYRYVGKYHKTKVSREKKERQINTIQNIRTAISGETIKDRIEGITYITNPIF